MATGNPNPIRTNDNEDHVEYIIPQEYSQKMICITVKIELDAKGWLYQTYNFVFVKTLDKYIQKSPEPTHLKLDYGYQLSGKKSKVVTRVDRFRDGNESPIAPKVTYHLLIEAGNELLDDFDLTSTNDNPSQFFSKIKFIQGV